MYLNVKIFYRNVVKNKLTSFINVFSLTIGLTCTILVLLWVQDELLFDTFHQNLDHLYRVVVRNETTDAVIHQAVTPAPLAPALKQEFPEIVKATRCNVFGEWLMQSGESIFTERGVAFVDPDFLDMFTFPLKQGDAQKALDNPFSILISEKMARKYFQESEAMGQTIFFDDKYDMKVTGVFQNCPENSTFQFDFIIPFEFLRERENIDFWQAHLYYTFVQLENNVSASDVNDKIAGVLGKHDPNKKYILYLQKFKDIHLRSSLNYDVSNRGNIKYIWIFSSLAVFILLIACINFMVLTTANFTRRMNEIGVRKVFGSHRKHLVLQFLTESLLLTLVALSFALFFVDLLLPVFNQLTGKLFTFAVLFKGPVFKSILLISLMTSILAGSYPALFLSRFQPVHIVKKGSLPHNLNMNFRRGLVITQFTVSIFLVIATIIVSRQLNYMQGKDLGFTKEHIIYINMKRDFLKDYASFRDQLLQNPYIVNVTASFQLPNDIGSSPGGFEWEGQKPGQEIRMNASLVDYDYFETFDMKMTEGRRFSRKFTSDDSAAYIVNEAAVRAMGLESPVGKRFSFWNTPGYIIGVVKDFHAQSLHSEINPVVFKIDKFWLNYIFVRINSAHIQPGIEYIRNVWENRNPNYPFEYHFLDQQIDKYYQAEKKMRNLVIYSAILTIVLACLGLLALTRVTIEQRTKEMGIRKVLGATFYEFLVLLSGTLLKWIVVANLIAWPLAWYSSHKWLQNFAYRIHIDIWTFLLTGLLTLFIALLTILYQIIKANRVNPVQALRYE